MPDTCLVTIATGFKYHSFVKCLIESAKTYFIDHDVLLFTDCREDFGVNQVFHKNEGYPKTTLNRYKTILSEECQLERYDNIFYCDIDMLFVASVGGAVVGPGLSAVLHAGYVGRRGPVDMNTRSTAYLPRSDRYYAGGFVGGESKVFLDMARTISQNVDKDLENNYIALWHDESHLNRYLQDNPPTRILNPGYCHPDTKLSEYYHNIWSKYPDYNEDWIPRLCALEKHARTECRRCGAPIYERGLCEAHYAKEYFPNTVCICCTEPSLSNGLCGSHNGLVQVVEIKTNRIKWTAPETADHLVRVGLANKI